MIYIRKIINGILNDEITDKNSVALLFSGGTDSLTCLFSLLDIGVKPTLYSFHLEGIEHEDIIVSKKVSKYYNLNHVIVEIPKDLIRLKEDVVYLTKTMKLNRKTNVQCSYPFLHVLPKVNEKYVVGGLCADDLYGTSKSMSIKYAKDKVGFDVARKKIFENQLSSAYAPIKSIVEMNGKKFITPYRDGKLINFFMSKSWEELNKPKQKQVAVSNYKEYFDELNVYRRNTNLQVGSKIREWHNELIATDLNVNNRNRVDEIYKDLYKEGNDES